MIQKIAAALNIEKRQVQAVLDLFDDGGTIPFIARYRKEKTGGLDEVIISQIKDLQKEIDALEQRRAFILKSIEDQGKLTPALKSKIENADKMTELEDVYLPYKPKRKTRASIAKEKGLEPLAKKIFLQEEFNIDAFASGFVNVEKGVADQEEALAGARDIIAEWVSEDADIRNSLRRLFTNKSIIQAKVISFKKEEKEAQIFKDYFEYTELLKKIPSHRFLAILRGNNEGILRITIRPEADDAIHILSRKFLKNKNACTDQVEKAIADSYKRMLLPSLETEVKNEAKKVADKEAINVFAQNLQEILLAAPLGQKRVLAIDPGFRTGCKVVCLDEQGDLLENTTIYPHTNKPEQAMQTLVHLCKKHHIENIAIGNGTAGKETRTLVNQIDELKEIPTIMISENGASIYSASETAREEFPELDLTVRGAISIGRRLQDPLAELVKIDAKSIGVGQYQHDVQQDLLKESLDNLVVSLVNRVGVDVNSASKQLLSYVAGLGNQKALNIIEYRKENGSISSKAALKKIKGIGPKAYEQAAGFIRISDAKNPLDRSAVHPESFGIVKQMAKDLNCTVNDLVEKADLRKSINLKNYSSNEIGLFTLNDILAELEKPGRDPRGNFEQIEFRLDLNSIEDLNSGMILTGLITNVTKFGAFVDIGVHQDGLVHISQLANKFVKDPFEVVKVNQKVTVKVMEVDVDRKRITLSIKEAMS